MLNSNKVIVLSSLKYKDNDLIVKCYTRNKGIVSYIIRGAFKSKRGRAKSIYFQPLSQLKIEEVIKPNRSLQSIKEVKFSYIYETLTTDVYKNAIAFFIADILSIVLKEEETNNELFEFLELSFQYIDKEDQFANFHLLFLLKLSKYLGFYPDVSNIELTYFNLEKGVFQSTQSSIYSISGNVLTLLKQLLGINFDTLNTIKINAKQRQEFLSMLLYYFELHLGDFKKPKSLQVLNDVFH